MDVSGAYLTSAARKFILIRLPHKYRYGRHDQFYILLKALYGADDSGRCFFEDWIAYHIILGFKKIVHEQCYLYYELNGQSIELVWHVDDNFYFRKGERLWQWYQAKIAEKYIVQWVDIEDGETFTGFRIKRGPGYVAIDQVSHVDKMLRALHMIDAKGRDHPHGKVRPTADHAPITKAEIELARRTPYFQAAGNLQWLQTISHPELTLSTKIVASRLQDHGQVAWNWVKGVLRFLVKNPYPALVLRPGNMQLRCFSDSDHGKEPDTRRSLGGYIIQLGESTVDWSAFFIKTVAHSTAESELMAVDAAQRRLRLCIHLAHQLRFPQQIRRPIALDNERAKELCEHPIQPGANGHMHMKYFSVREWIDKGVIRPAKVDSEDNLADVLVTFKSPAVFARLVSAVKGYQFIDSIRHIQ